MIAAVVVPGFVIRIESGVHLFVVFDGGTFVCWHIILLQAVSRCCSGRKNCNLVYRCRGSNARRLLVVLVNPPHLSWA